MSTVPRRAPAVIAVLGVGTAALLLGTFVSLALGVVPVSWAEVTEVLGDLVRGRRGASIAATLVVDVRLPRAVGAICVGAALATAGCVLQALLRNPLASPFVIGTAQASGFGALLAILFGASGAAPLVVAFAMSVVAMVVVLALARTERSLPTESVVLTGLAVSLLFTALTGLTRYLAHDEGVVSRMALWVLGGLWQVTWAPLALLAPVALAAVATACVLWRRLDLLALGESDAQRLGVDVRRTGTAFLLLACAMTAVAVCIGGVVAFVGLIVPHAARRLVGAGHAALLPASAFLGAVFVMTTDVIARTAVPPEELPLGVVTSLLGVPAFLVLFRSLRARRSGL